jgi:uncharacterized membrane protein
MSVFKLMSYSPEAMKRGSGSQATGGEWPHAVLITATAALACAYFALVGLLQHWNFYSTGWDLGVFDQVLWNTAQGRYFDYSFRPYSYLADHFSPALILLTPLPMLGFGSSSLLVVQALAFGLAAVPLFAACRRLAGPAAAWLICGAYILSLSVMRAVTFDFHPEAFVPLLAFTALWGLACGRGAVFVLASLALLTLKEDMFILVLGMAWLAWLGFGERRGGLIVGGAALAYTAAVSLLVMPQYQDGITNPAVERYSYLGDSLPSIGLGAVAHPQRILEHVLRWQALGETVLLLAGVAFLPLLSPRLWPPLALLLIVPLAAEQAEQSKLALHYAVVPGTFAIVVSVITLSSPVLTKGWGWLATHRGYLQTRGVGAPLAAAACAFVLAVVLFALKSPAPPSFAAHEHRYTTSAHGELAESFVRMVPADAKVSAQSTFLPHLTQRRDVFEFPRVFDAEYVLLDRFRPVPDYSKPGFEECRDVLPGLGFERIRGEEDGLSLWRRIPDAVAIIGCSR